MLVFIVHNLTKANLALASLARAKGQTSDSLHAQLMNMILFLSPFEDCPLKFQAWEKDLLQACLSVLQGSSYKPNNARRLHPQITPFSLFSRPEAYSILWPQFLSWRGYIRFSLWRPRWAYQSTRGVVFPCCPPLHCATFRAAHLRGSFNRVEHCFTVSIIPSLTFSLLFPPLCCLAVWAGRFGGKRPRSCLPPACGFACSGNQ